MHVIESQGGTKSLVVVRTLDKGDLAKIKRKEYFFDWKSARKGADVYKLCLVDDDSIIGLVALVNVPTDQRIEIKLLASSKANVGSSKKYEGIAGCLLSFACREAISLYGELACISLLPKTELKQHYVTKYGMLDGGRHLYCEGKELMDLIKKYPL